MNARVVLSAAVVLWVGVAVGQASAGLQPSANVAVIPGFEAPVYTGTHGIPTFPTGRPQLSNYRFAQLSSSGVTTKALQSYDTVVLYGLRWTTLSPTAQTAINTFARTGKVVIWDSDSTGSQSYSSFVHPFSVKASGEEGPTTGSVVTFISNGNPLASSDPSSALYLNPTSLVASTHLIGHMSVLEAGAAEWAPGLIAANASIPGGGWVLAWGYGKTGDHSGMVVYSGMDADAFNDQLSPNYALKELGIELAAPFLRAADPSCAPSCSAPSVGPAGGGAGGGGTGGGGGGTGGGGAGGGGGGAGGGTGGGGTQSSFAQCSLDRKAPSSWVHGRVALYLKTSVAAKLTLHIVAKNGKAVGTARTLKPGHLKALVNTKRLPSNRISKIFADVFVAGSRACRVSIALRVDNVAPRLLRLTARRTLQASLLTLRVTEASRLTIVTGGRARHFKLRARKTFVISIPKSAKPTRLVFVDRAGNTLRRSVTWR
jgi:hypothetical protein